MEQIRVSSNVKRIQVNDKGEYITIDLGNAQKIQQYQDILKKLKDMMDDLSDDDTVEVKINACKEIAVAIDDIFGSGACIKVFECECPYPDMIGDFFAQINPIINKHMNERVNKMNQKYNVNRKKG